MTVPAPKDLSNEALAARARQGAVACFAELVRRYEGRLYNFLLRRVRCPADAEDLTQDTFVRAWQRIEQYDPRWQFSTWLFTIGHRLAITRRRMPLTNGRTDLAAGTGRDPAETASRREQGALAWDLADRVLNERQRTMLWLRYAEDLSNRDIARVLGTSSVVVRVTLFRARERLAGCLERSSTPHPAAAQLAGDMT